MKHYLDTSLIVAALAIAASHGLEVCTLDHRLAEGGSAVGVPTQLLG